MTIIKKLFLFGKTVLQYVLVSDCEGEKTT